MFRIAAPAAHHIFPLMDPLPPLAEQLLGAEINKIPHTLVCGILVREAGLELSTALLLRVKPYRFLPKPEEIEDISCRMVPCRFIL
jgi:hypothetical protein